MAIFVDPPMWPAHGTLWCHLVSDVSYEELHEFAKRVPLPRRGFDIDHYDVPASLHSRVVALGANEVSAKDVVHLLRGAGLRVKHIERESVRPVRRREYLVSEWAKLPEIIRVSLRGNQANDWTRLGEELITRWNEPHRSYHNEKHLEDVLFSLDQLGTRGELIQPVTLLSAWFHDAVYQGQPDDERASAELAVNSLSHFDLGSAVLQQVSEYIIATSPTESPKSVDPGLAQLLDADLAIFAAGESRYWQYAEAVRGEYAHIATEDFSRARAGILNQYLEQPRIYRTESAHEIWESRARSNLAREISQLQSNFKN